MLQQIICISGAVNRVTWCRHSAAERIFSDRGSPPSAVTLQKLGEWMQSLILSHSNFQTHLGFTSRNLTRTSQQHSTAFNHLESYSVETGPTCPHPSTCPINTNSTSLCLAHIPFLSMCLSKRLLSFVIVHASTTSSSSLFHYTYHPLCKKDALQILIKSFPLMTQATSIRSPLILKGIKSSPAQPSNHPVLATSL